MSLTDDIRGLCAQIIAKCDAIDATQNPTGPTAPAPLDCLAGTVPPATGMYDDELYEAAWINKRAEYRTTMRDAPSGSILFLGDSMIERGDFSQVSPWAVNLGISGESSRQLQYRLNENDAAGQPNLIHRAGAAVILTGVNDLSDSRNGSPLNAAATVNIVMDRIVNWTSGKVVICKLVPVDTAVFPTTPSIAAIASVNAHIDTYASLPWVKIVDVNATLAPQGSLLPQYHVDGQHLNESGYAVLYAAMRDALVQHGVL